MDTQAIVLASLRGVHLIALASLFGTLVSLALVAPAGLREAGGAAAQTARRRLVRLASWSDAVALAFGVGWLLLETATMAGAPSIGATFAALGTVARETQFGHLVLARLALLVLALPLLGARGWRLAVPLLLTGAALGMQGGIGHAGAQGGSTGAMLLASEALHLLAAGAWLGGLLPLSLLVGTLPPPAAATACESFSPVGLSAVLAIACTAIVQAWVLIGGLGGLFGTDYGHIALLKLGCFFSLLLLAGTNRFVLTSRLRNRTGPVAVRTMQVSLAAETVLGAAVIVVAAFLASGLPATHATPVWPFSWRPSLDQLYDPYGRLLVFYAVLPSLIAAALLAASRFWRVLFWPALGGLIVCLVLAWWNLVPLLTIDAYPTTFAASPTEFAAGSIVRGAKLFAADCVACHGTHARGDGPLAKTLPLAPADLTAPHFWAHTEGDVYWFITHGIDAAPGVHAMPAIGAALSSGNVWSLIDFLKANNAGFSMRSTGRWDHPTPLPQFDAICADGSAINGDDLRGRVVHIIAVTRGAMTPPPPPPGLDVATILLTHGAGLQPVGKVCVTLEPEVWDAFAILLGVSPDDMAGMQALADANFWLRLRWRPGDPQNWNDPPVLAAAIREIAAHPLAVGAGGGHAHHH